LRKIYAVSLLAICEVAALALWFSASAVVPSMSAAYPMTDWQISLFTSAVQAGFVVGTLISAAFGLADRLDPRRFFMAATLIAAAANAAIVLLEPGSVPVFGARFVTGLCMAGVYPIGMKMVSSWAKGDLGMLVAILVGALTLGSASPHLFNAFGGVDWQFTILSTSAAAALAALTINLMPVGPGQTTTRQFRLAQVTEAFRNRALVFANLGYLGHMWELYAMWAWIGIFLHASFSLDSAGFDVDLLTRLMTFLVMGIGGFVGCVGGGWLSDRFGRTWLTIWAMTISGLCALTVGLLFGASPYLIGLFCLLWGVTVVADSAQFSASVAELAAPELVGTMLTAQTCAGFVLTLVTIHLMPVFVDLAGWRYAFMPLALGPLFGVWAMARLRRLPDARKLANGKR